MTAQDDSVMALRSQLRGLPCPTFELVPTLQCDYYPDGCLWIVRCHSCRAQYHLDHRSTLIWEKGTETASEAAQAIIPHG